MEHNFHDFHRGEVYYADLNPVFGHEQGGTRPVLVLQNDVGNYYSPTLIVTAITRRTFKKPSQPTHVVLDDVEGLEPSLFIHLSSQSQTLRRWSGRCRRTAPNERLQWNGRRTSGRV